MYSGLPQIETSQRMTVKNCVAITVFWRAGGHAHAATRNPQPATRNHKRVAEAHIAAAAPPTKRTSHHQPATTSLPMVLPLSRRRCASRRVCAQIGESVSVWVVRSSPASIRLAARFENAVLLDHVVRGIARTGEHQLPVDADALGFVRVANRQRAAWLHDQPHMPLRRQDLAELRPVAVRIGQVERRVHLVQADRLQLRVQWLVVVDHMLRAHLSDPFNGFRPRRGGDDGEARMPRQLDGDGSHAARAADDQQVFATVARAVERERHALEQQLPRSERGQWHRGGLRKAQRRRLAAGDARIHQVIFGVAALAPAISCVIDLVADRKRGDVRAHGFNHASGVEAQHLRCGKGLRLGRAQLGIDRIHRHRFDTYQ